jgi:hypothetical protein
MVLPITESAHGGRHAAEKPGGNLDSVEPNSCNSLLGIILGPSAADAVDNDSHPMAKPGAPELPPKTRCGEGKNLVDALPGLMVFTLCRRPIRRI